jgi:hypothetical protein
MAKILTIVVFFTLFGAVVGKMVDGMARVGPRDSFLMVLGTRWFLAIGTGLASLAHLLIPRDDSFADRAFVALMMFPLGGLLVLTLLETGTFLGMAVRASRTPDDSLGLLPGHWFDRRLERFIRRRLWLSRLLDSIFRTRSHPGLVQ